MPLFGNNTTTTTGGGPLHKGDPAYNGTGNATGHHGHTGPGPVIGGAAGGVAGHEAGHTAVGTALGAAAGQHHANKHPDVARVPAGANYANNAGTGAGVGAGMGAGVGAGAGHGPGTGTSTGGAGEKAFVGKLEHAAGSVLCSSTLKEKGLQKEREAQAIKVQASEIGQAEGLETEAAARRERAVAHGAHPHHLGGGAGTGGTGRV